MKIFLDFFAVILFYIAYQFYTQIPETIIHNINSWFATSFIPGEKSNAIYFAVLIGIIASGIQTLLHWIIDRKLPKSQSITFIAFLLIGGMTLMFRDPIFIYWKPTIINAIMAAVFFGSTFIGKKSLAERIMGSSIQAPKLKWQRVTNAWAAFFMFIAILNIIIAYSFSESIWVNFKLFGILSLTLIFIVLQGIYLAKYIQPESE